MLIDRMDAPMAEIVEFVRPDSSQLKSSNYIVVGEARQRQQSILTSLLASARSQFQKSVHDMERMQDNLLFLPAFLIFLYFVLSYLRSAFETTSPIKSNAKSIQMRLYTLTKRQFALVFVCFFSCFLITVLIGLAGPKIINTRTVNDTAESGDMNGPFRLESPVLSTFNQQLWLLADVKVNNPPGSHISRAFTLGVHIFYVDIDASGHYGIRAHNRSRVLSCYGMNCDPVIVLHLGFLEYKKLKVEVVIYGLEDLENMIGGVSFEFKTYNPIFTQVEIWFRFAFLVLSFIITCMYAHSLRLFHMRDWTIEQKWMSLLLPLLLLYNDPVFPLSFLVNSWIPGFVDTVFQATFLCALLLFWLCVYHGIRATSERRRFLTFYFPKLILCSLLWLAAVVLGSWQQYNELTDPTYQYKLDIRNFTGMKILFFIVGGLYILYLMFLLIRACTELRLKPYFNLRLKFLTLLTAFVLIISIAIIVLRFGSNVLQDNFVADISTQYDNSAEFVCFYALLNFYMYTMAFVYSPSKNAKEESDFERRGGFSLLNDSDEDVLYGSDSEDVPLSNGKIRRPHFYEDSD